MNEPSTSASKSLKSYQLGLQAEQFAASWIRSALAGQVLAQRYVGAGHCEVDVIAQVRQYLVAFEVKYRRSSRLVDLPTQALSAAKVRRLASALEQFRGHFLLKHLAPRIDVLFLSPDSKSPNRWLVRHWLGLEDKFGSLRS
jgi:Holliday junction resolvase-like predicted endonuclease